MNTRKRPLTSAMGRLGAMALSLIVMLGTSLSVSADEADAKRLLKAMSDYVGSQKNLSFDYDAILEVVTDDGETLALASSGAVSLSRPDKIHATRHGGFADAEMSFDGKTLTVLGENLNIYAQEELPGTVDQLAGELRLKYGRPLPAEDLLVTDSYDALMLDVVDVKDLGSGVIGGVECDYLAFRAKEVDWQIWIAQGKEPYPCRYVIQSKLVAGAPQYSIQVRNWRTGSAVAPADFSFTNKTKAKKVDLDNLEGTEEMPKHFATGESK
jgi:hypothetical protein